MVRSDLASASMSAMRPRSPYDGRSSRAATLLESTSSARSNQGTAAARPYWFRVSSPRNTNASTLRGRAATARSTAASAPPTSPFVRRNRPTSVNTQLSRGAIASARSNSAFAARLSPVAEGAATDARGIGLGAASGPARLLRAPFADRSEHLRMGEQVAGLGGRHARLPCPAIFGSGGDAVAEGKLDRARMIWDARSPGLASSAS